MEDYRLIHQGIAGFIRRNRGLMAIWGKEAERFLNGMITNDIRMANDKTTLKAAFANAQGRLIALARIKRVNDRFLIETDESTHQRLFENLSRFTLAGDFFIENLTNQYKFFHTFNISSDLDAGLSFDSNLGTDFFVPSDDCERFIEYLKVQKSAIEISEQSFQLLRIEAGMPLYGVDMDESTVVPELGEEGLISYNKGCYIGQEIIARIHFRGHVAKRLRGLVFLDEPESLEFKTEIKSPDDKNAGYITSYSFSPHFAATIALGYVRYEYLAEDTLLKVAGKDVKVKDIPFINFTHKRQEAINE
jgi:aminomethyltransferase